MDYAVGSTFQVNRIDIDLFVIFKIRQSRNKVIPEQQNVE